MTAALLAVLGVCAAGACAAAVRDRAWGALALRLIALAVAGSMLIAGDGGGGAEPRRARLAVVMDASRSMAEGGGLERVRGEWLDGATLDAMGDGAEVEGFVFGGALRRVGVGELATVEARGDASRLRAAVASLAVEGVDAALVLTDGRVTADDEGMVFGGRDGAFPVYAAVVESAAVARLELDVAASPARVAPGETVTLRVRMDAPAGGAAVVVVTEVERGSDMGVVREAVVAQREVSLVGSPARVDIEVETPADARGVVEWRVRASGVSRNEGVEDAASAFVTVRSAPVRALLLDAAPGWTTRFVSSALRDDPAIELTSVIALGGAQERVERAREGFDPASIELDAFDVLVVGAGAGRWVDDAALVGRVRDGAGLLALAHGDAPEGLALGGATRGALYPDARVRSRAEGAGLVAGFEGEDAWRVMFGEWADPTLPARLARWLAQRRGEEFAAVEVDRASARVGESVGVSLRYPPEAFPPDGAVVRVVGESGSEAQVELRRVDLTRPVLSGAFVAEREGVYEARSGEAPWPARFEARPARDDELLAPADVAAVRAMAARSGGRLIERQDLEGVLAEVRELAAQGPRGDHREPAPDRRVWAAALAVGALLIEWMLRRLRRA